MLIRPAEEIDAYALAPRVRRADRDELEAGGSDDMLEALLVGVRGSVPAKAVEAADGRVAALYGVRPDPDTPGLGVIWLMGADALTADRRWFLRASKSELLDLVAGYTLVYNIVDDRYQEALRWLSWLGFRAAWRDLAAASGLPVTVMALEVADGTSNPGSGGRGGARNRGDGGDCARGSSVALQGRARAEEDGHGAAAG